MAADYVSKEMINKAMQVDLLEYAKSLGMEFETRGSNNTLYQKGHSLNITRSKNMYYHFSTGKGGNVINFAMEQNGWTFQQAVRSLCGEEIQKSLPKHILRQSNCRSIREKWYCQRQTLTHAEHLHIWLKPVTLTIKLYHS